MFSQRELYNRPAHRCTETLDPCTGAQSQPLRGVRRSPTVSDHQQAANARGMLCIVRGSGHGVHILGNDKSTTGGTHAIQPSERKRFGRCKAASLNCARCGNWTSTSAVRDFLARQKSQHIPQIPAAARTVEDGNGEKNTPRMRAECTTNPRTGCLRAHVTHSGSRRQPRRNRTPPTRTAANARTLQPRRAQSCTPTERGGQNPIGLT
jgi:hypothetical protein